MDKRLSSDSYVSAPAQYPPLRAVLASAPPPMATAWVPDSYAMEESGRQSAISYSFADMPGLVAEREAIIDSIESHYNASHTVRKKDADELLYKATKQKNHPALARMCVTVAGWLQEGKCPELHNEQKRNSFRHELILQACRLGDYAASTYAQRIQHLQPEDSTKARKLILETANMAIEACKNLPFADPQRLEFHFIIADACIFVAESTADTARKALALTMARGQVEAAGMFLQSYPMSISPEQQQKFAELHHCLGQRFAPETRQARALSRDNPVIPKGLSEKCFAIALSPNIVDRAQLNQLISQYPSLATSCSTGGVTLLMIAAWQGDDGLVQLLLDAGANHSARDGYYLTTQDWARKSGRKSTIQLIKAKDLRTIAADTHNETHTPEQLKSAINLAINAQHLLALHHVAKRYFDSQLRLVLSDEHLQLAVRKKNIIFVQTIANWLVQFARAEGRAINTRDALLEAVKGGSPQLVYYFLDWHGLPEDPIAGHTLLYWALTSNDRATFDALVARGALTSAPDVDGTPLLKVCLNLKLGAEWLDYFLDTEIPEGSLKLAIGQELPEHVATLINASASVSDADMTAAWATKNALIVQQIIQVLYSATSEEELEFLRAQLQLVRNEPKKYTLATVAAEACTLGHRNVFSSIIKHAGRGLTLTPELVATVAANESFFDILKTQYSTESNWQENLTNAFDVATRHHAVEAALRLRKSGAEVSCALFAAESARADEAWELLSSMAQELSAEQTIELASNAIEAERYDQLAKLVECGLPLATVVTQESEATLSTTLMGHAVRTFAFERELAEALLRLDINIDDGDFSPLAIAATRGHEKWADFFIEKAADINKTTKNGDSPLQWAAYKGYTKIVSKLLDTGKADYAAKNGEETAYDMALKNGHVGCAELLIIHEIRHAHELDITDAMAKLERLRATKASDK